VANFNLSASLLCLITCQLRGKVSYPTSKSGGSLLILTELKVKNPRLQSPANPKSCDDGFLSLSLSFIFLLTLVA
jgi:hypothetical protein